MNPTLITTAKFAKLLNVSTSLVKQWVAAGRLVPAQRPTPRLSLFDPRDVEKFRSRDTKRGPKASPAARRKRK